MKRYSAVKRIHRLWRGLAGWGACIRSFEAGTEVKVGRGLGYEEEKGRCVR